MLIESIDSDVVAGSRLSWRQVELLGSIERDEDGTEAAARFTSWAAAASRDPTNAARLARSALECPLTDEQRDSIIAALIESLRLCSSQEWLDDDDHHFFFEERFVATEICRFLADAVCTPTQAASVAPEVGRVVTDASDLRTVSAAADAIAAIAERFPEECVEAAAAVRAQLRAGDYERYLFRAALQASDELSPEDATRGLLGSGEAAVTLLADLGPQPPEYWAEVRARSVEAIDIVDEASGEQMWIVEAALHIAIALAAQRVVIDPIVAAAARALTRVREQPTNQWRFSSMCQLALGLALSSDNLAPQIYEVVGFRLSPDPPIGLVGLLKSGRAV